MLLSWRKHPDHRVTKVDIFNAKGMILATKKVYGWHYAHTVAKEYLKITPNAAYVRIVLSGDASYVDFITEKNLKIKKPKYKTARYPM